MLVEKVYPFLIALILTFFAKHFKINYIDSKGINDALNGILTITTLIIGFWGAVFPVVLNAKNKMAIVSAIFRKDNKGLYSKYMKEMLLSGMVLIVVTLSVFFRENYKDTLYYNYVFYALVFFFIWFICSTFRCLHITVSLIFMDNTLQEKYRVPEKTELTKVLDEKLKKEHRNNG